jgi:acylphosphatase
MNEFRENVRMSASFQGRVQGVGFRYTVVHLAEDYAVTGYVRNEWDGTVKLIAEGEREELKRFLSAINSSRLQRYIHSFSTNWGHAAGTFRAFGVKM